LRKGNILKNFLVNIGQRAKHASAKVGPPLMRKNIFLLEREHLL